MSYFLVFASSINFYVWFVIQGEQKSPGIIPLAVKDVFGIIQEVVDAFLN